MRIEFNDPYILEYKDVLIFERDADGRVRIEGKERDVLGTILRSDKWYDSGLQEWFPREIRKIQIWTK